MISCEFRLISNLLSYTIKVCHQQLHGYETWLFFNLIQLSWKSSSLYTSILLLFSQTNRRHVARLNIFCLQSAKLVRVKQGETSRRNKLRFLSCAGSVCLTFARKYSTRRNCRLSFDKYCDSNRCVDAHQSICKYSFHITRATLYRRR